MRHRFPVSYAVVWSRNGGPVRAGNVQLDAEAFTLSGLECGPASAETRERLPFADVETARVERRKGVRLVGLPTLVLELAAGRDIRIASVDRAGSFHELADLLGAAVRSRIA